MTKPRGWLFVLFTIVIVTALSLPAQPTNATPDFCSNCAEQCWNEANTGVNNAAYWRCIDDGYSQTTRDNLSVQYYNNCVSIFCNQAGCNIQPMKPTPCRVGPC